MARKKQIKDLDQIDGKAKPSPRKRVKKKIQEVEHINGKVELSPVDKAKQAAQDLDKILGMRQKNPFDAKSMAQFEDNLKGKNLTDLREMAVKAGIFPSGNPTLLRKKLKKGFEDYIKGKDGSQPTIPLNNKNAFPSSKAQEEVNKIWARK